MCGLKSTRYRQIPCSCQLDFHVTAQQFRYGGFKINVSVQYMPYLCADRHVDPVLLCNPVHDLCGMKPFNGLSQFIHVLLRCLPLRQGQSQTTVPGLVVGTGEYQVSHARQTHQGFPVCAQALPQTHHFRQGPW